MCRALKARDIPAQGNALGEWGPQMDCTLEGCDRGGGSPGLETVCMPVDCRTPSGCKSGGLTETQGVALGWYVAPLRG